MKFSHNKLKLNILFIKKNYIYFGSGNWKSEMPLGVLGQVPQQTNSTQIMRLFFLSTFVFGTFKTNGHQF